MKTSKVNVDILVVKNDKILLGLLTEKWNLKGKQVWGVPGRDIYFGEKIGDKNLIECYLKNRVNVAE
jgi:hypothetical protein